MPTRQLFPRLGSEARDLGAPHGGFAIFCGMKHGPIQWFEALPGEIRDLRLGALFTYFQLWENELDFKRLIKMCRCF